MIEHAQDSGCGEVFEDAKSFEIAANKVLKMNPSEIERKAKAYLRPYTWENAARQYVKIYRQLV
jgi:hypothetical protein